jgi:tetratricopeptide (TPR) repeat protein
MRQFFKESFIPVLLVLFLLIGIILYLQRIAVEVSRKPTIIKITNQFTTTIKNNILPGYEEPSGTEPPTDEFVAELEKNINFQQGRRWYREGKYELAKQFFTRALAEEKENYCILNYLGVIALKLNNLYEAEQLLLRSIAQKKILLQLILTSGWYIV